MGKCNLIAPPTSSSGDFILFSQYSEDLTRASQSEDFYRVTPSKYILLNISKEFEDVRLAEILQNYYEKSCSVIRSQEPEWNPEWSAALLWKTLTKTWPTGILRDASILGKPKNITGGVTLDDVLVIGDINITSTKQVDGINYSEIYVNVPQGEHPGNYLFTKYSSDTYRDYTYYPVIDAQQLSPYISGYPDSDYPAPVGEPWPTNHIRIIGKPNINFYDFSQRDELTDSVGYGYSVFGDDCIMLQGYEPVDTLDFGSYSFNAVLILYDVHKKNLEDPSDTTIYRGIPMGMYVNRTNPVTMFTSNQDIYGQGTSYGLRICTRYVSTQNRLHIIDSTIEDVQGVYDQYAAVMGKIGDSQSKMDSILSGVQYYSEDITSHLGNVKNFKVNVPYIRVLGGVPYWFVNGRNLGIATSYNTLRWQNY